MTALSNKERQRRFREKRDSDPQRRAEYLAKKRQKYLSDLKDGKRKNMNSLTEREKRSTRRYWKVSKRAYRKRMKEVEYPSTLTPPNSLSENMSQTQGPSYQQLSANRKKRKSMAKCYRDNKILKDQIKCMSKKMAAYRMRLFREKMGKNSKRLTDQPETPRTKTRNLLKHWSKNEKCRQKVYRALNFHHAMSDQLSKDYKKGNIQKKQSIAEVLTGRIMKKYGLCSTARRSIGVFSGYHKRKKRGSKTKREAKKLLAFFERDDVSRLTAGQKQSITLRGIKKQRRILNYSLQELHEQYSMENKEIPLSYSSFCRHRPWWVLPPRESDRETCACKIHENTRFLATELKRKQLLNTDNLSILVTQAACSTSDKKCMYGNCRKCKDVCIIQVDKKMDLIENVKWFQWVTKKEVRMIKSEEKEITLTQKDEIHGTVGDLIDEFHSQIERFKIHYFNIENQMKHYRDLKENMKTNEVMLHVDFAENFECKMSKEIQTMHFGASKRQITLHTGVYRTGGSDNSVPFCSVSDSLEHGPPAIWAHLEPVLKSIQKNYPNIDTIHFFSDGPSSQYRQKGNFQLFTTEMADYGFKYATWNFHETGHGKGAPDGVGAALKRSADFQVLHGQDILSASDFVHKIQEKETSIALYEVSDKEIALKHAKMTTVKTVPGTLKIHQIITNIRGEMRFRDTSCTCTPGKEHTGHELRKVRFLLRKSDGKSDNEKHMKSVEPESTSNEDMRQAKPETQNGEKKREGGQIIDRDACFENILESLSKCSTFDILKKECEIVIDRIKQYDLENFRASIMNTGLPIDETAMTLFPSDVPGDVLYPVCVKADGNCLSYAGSVIAFGNQNHATEMRVRIILELVLYSNLYLNQEYLQRGFSCQSKAEFSKSYAMYSDEYVPSDSNRLNQTEIKSIYEREILKITQKYTYMGIWQLFALATILARPIYSIYPQHGNPGVRKDLNRLILPREQRDIKTSYIMWTSTRFDMTERNWIPNHFVPALPIDVVQKSAEKAENQDVLNIKVQRWRIMRKRKLARDKLVKKETENVIVIIDDEEDTQSKTKDDLKEKLATDVKATTKTLKDEDIKEVSKETNHDIQEKITIKEKNTNEEEPCEQMVIHTEENKKEIAETISQDNAENKQGIRPLQNFFNIEDPNDILNKYVIIQYRGKPYPGYVVNIDEQGVRVKCMHRTGKLKKCHFYWPKCVTDESSYDTDDVLAVIPEPLKIGTKYYVDPTIWEKILKDFSD